MDQMRQRGLVQPERKCGEVMRPREQTKPLSARLGSPWREQIGERAGFLSLPPFIASFIVLGVDGSSDNHLLFGGC